MNLEDFVKSNYDNLKKLNIDELKDLSYKHKFNFMKIYLSLNSKNNYENKIEEIKKEEETKNETKENIKTNLGKEKNKRNSKLMGRINTEYNKKNIQTYKTVHQIIERTYNVYKNNSLHGRIDIFPFKNYTYNNLEKANFKSNLVKKNILKEFKDKKILGYEIDKFIYNKKLDLRNLKDGIIPQIIGIYSNEEFPTIKYDKQFELIALKEKDNPISLIDYNDYLIKELNQKRKNYDSCLKRYLKNAKIKKESTLNFLGTDEVNFGQYLHLKNILEKKKIKLNATIYEKDKRKYNVMKKIVEKMPELFQNVNIVNDEINYIEYINFPKEKPIEGSEEELDYKTRYQKYVYQQKGRELPKTKELFYTEENDKNMIEFGEEKITENQYITIYSDIQQNLNKDFRGWNKKRKDISKEFHNAIKEKVIENENKYNIIYNNGKTFFG
jgi:hypothetical protein